MNNMDERISNNIINHSDRLAFLILARASGMSKKLEKISSSCAWVNWTFLRAAGGGGDGDRLLFRKGFRGAGGQTVIGGILCSRDVGVLNPSLSSSMTSLSFVDDSSSSGNGGFLRSCFAGVLMWSGVMFWDCSVVSCFLSCSCCWWSWGAWSWSDGVDWNSDVGFSLQSCLSESETLRTEIRSTRFDSMNDDHAKKKTERRYRNQWWVGRKKGNLEYTGCIAWYK